MGDALCIPAGMSACVTGPQRSCSGDDTLSPKPSLRAQANRV